MANAKIDIVGQGELTLIAELYSQLFKPPRDAEFFRRRFLGRYNPLIMVAGLEGQPVGFLLGFELKPTVFFTWLVGVQPEARRQGIASQMMEAVESWARNHNYESIRFECHNQIRPMLHLAIHHNYDIVGIRWDPDHTANLVILEKVLQESSE